MLWLASAKIVGRGNDVKMEKSRSRDVAARLTRNIITKVNAIMITMAYTTSNTNTSCSRHCSHCLISLTMRIQTRCLAAKYQQKKTSTKFHLLGCAERASGVSKYKISK